MKDLLFKNPTFRKGLNLTVRNGDKWFQAVQPGDMVRLVDNEDEEPAMSPWRCPYKLIMDADVLFTDYLPLREIPALWLKYGHDTHFKTHADLEARMVQVYGDEPITSKVTVIMFLTSMSYAATPPTTPAPVPSQEVDEPNSDDTLESDE